MIQLYYVSIALTSISFKVKLAIFIIQKGNIKNLQKITSGKLFRSVYVLNFVSLIFLLLEYIQSTCDIDNTIHIVNMFIVLSTIQQQALKMALKQLRKSQISQIKRKYAWHEELQRRAHNLFRLIPKEMKLEMKGTQTSQVWS